MTEINWRFEKPTEAEVAEESEVLFASQCDEISGVWNIEKVLHYWGNMIYAWAPMPAKPERPERKFFDGTTYSKPGMWIDQDGMLWFGPGLPNDNLHFATLDGFTDADHKPIWVYRASELPDGDYQRVQTTRVRPVERPKPKRMYWWFGKSALSAWLRSENRFASDDPPDAMSILPTDPTPEAIEEALRELAEIIETLPLSVPLTIKLKEIQDKLNPQTKP